jgi:serine protease Do
MTQSVDSQAAADLAVERVAPSLVSLRRGTGLVIAAGKVLTSAHNVRRDEVHVVFADGRRAVAQVAAVDVDADLAVLDVDTGEAPALDLANSGEARLGTPVMALAHPGRRGLRLTFGTVSGVERRFRGPRGREVTGGLEHTAPLSRGSAGGPLLDLDGRLLGINTLRLDEGFILALRLDRELRERIATLLGGASRRGVTLGVAVVPPRVARRLRGAVGLPERDGLLVRGVVEDSPADRAGLRRGDLLVAADGTPLESLDALFALLDAVPAPERLTLTVLRGSDELEVRVDLEVEPQEVPA